MSNYRRIFWILSIILIAPLVLGTEFTFSLKRSDEQCFFEIIDKDVLCEFEYQVSLQLICNNVLSKNEQFRFISFELIQPKSFFEGCKRWEARC